MLRQSGWRRGPVHLSRSFVGLDCLHVISVIAVMAVIAVIAAIAHSRTQSADRAVGMRDNSDALNSALRRGLAQRGAAARRQQKG